MHTYLCLKTNRTKVNLESIRETNSDSGIPPNHLLDSTNKRIPYAVIAKGQKRLSVKKRLVTKLR
jgi:hypothetical protein